MPSQRPGQNVKSNHATAPVSLRSLAHMASAFSLAALLTGCSGNIPANFGTSTPVSSYVQITGSAYGGQTPIVGATIQLYTVGTSGSATASTGLITQTPVSGQNLTDSNGNFNISGLYNGCSGSTPGTEVYLTATGGNPGGNTANADLAIVAALGDCLTLYNSAQAGTVHVRVNEATTIAAAYALAPFATNLTHIGAAGNEPLGLATAFANATLLADTSAGVSPGAALATGVTVPTAEIYTLADILAACVNSGGGTSGDGSACGTLFAATGVTTNTFDAALQIAKNPGKPAIVALYRLVPTQAPFQPTLPPTPKDYSIAVTFAGAGNLATPYGLAIDASGNAWVTNESGTNLNQFTPTGTAAAYTATGLVGAEGIAIDNSGNVWVANTAGNSVIKFPSGSPASAASFTVGGITAPSAVAIDHNNNIFIANLNGNSVTELNTSGAALNSSPFLAGGNITVPTGIAVSPTGGNVLVTSGSSAGSVVILSNTGAYQASLTDGTLQGPVSLAYGSGYLAVSGYTTGSAVGNALSEFGGSGTPLSFSPAASGLNAPAGIASDGTSFFIANSAASGSLAQFPVNSTTAASPSAGFNSLNTPESVAIDASGCVWTTASGSNTVAKFIGLAQPVATPLVTNVGP